MERDVRMPALKTEEAALLPALDRQSMTGGSALKYALQKAKAAAAVTGKAVPTAPWDQAQSSGVKPSCAACTRQSAARPPSRAALRHALNKRR